MPAPDFNIHEHGEVDSTNVVALAALTTGEAKHGDAHWARSQTGGRGRRGATWWSPAGEGVYLSVVLLPEAPYSAPGLTMAVGMAVRDALRDHGLLPGRGLLLSWPNDVVFGGAKLAGVLVEARDLDTPAPKYVVGVGVNVKQTGFPADLTGEREVASLATLGVQAEVESVRDAVLHRLGERLAALQADAAGEARHYLVGTNLFGHHVRLEVGEEVLEGVLIGVSPEDGLRVQTATGEERRALEHVTGLEEILGRTNRLGRL